MEPKTLFIVFMLLFLALLIGLLFWLLFRHYGLHSAINRTTQRQITDHDLLLLIDAQPDGLLTVQQLAEQTGLSVSQARRRLMLLLQWGILKVFYGNKLQGFYSLVAPLDRREPPQLSPEPFLTVDDILKIFRHFDFRLTPQDLITSTRLPAYTLQRELQYFQREGVVQLLQRHTAQGAIYQKIYVLQEPYRSKPEIFLQQGDSRNLELRELLRREDLI